MSNTVIPTSTSVVESSLIPAHISQVWHLIKLRNFSSWWSILEKSGEVDDSSPETETVSWKYKDGTVQDIKQEEHSVGLVLKSQWHKKGTATDCKQALEHFITYSIISSTPALTYTSSISRIRLFEVTSGPHAGGTFVQWSGNFSGDADAGVIEDAKFKRREALADLAKAAAGVGTGKHA